MGFHYSQIMRALKTEIVTLNATHPSETPQVHPENPNVSPKHRVSGYNRRIIHLYLKTHWALFEDLKGVTRVQGKCHEEDVRRCGVDVAARIKVTPGRGPPAQSSGSQCACARLIWCHYVWLCAFDLIHNPATAGLLHTQSRTCIHRQAEQAQSHKHKHTSAHKYSFDSDSLSLCNPPFIHPLSHEIISVIQ